MRLPRDEALGLSAEIAGVLGEHGFTLHIGRDSRRWYLRLPNVPDIVTRPPLAALGDHIDPYLPSGPERRFWHRLANDVQMVLHGTAINAARERRGEPPINSLWFWGAGTLPARTPVRLGSGARRRCALPRARPTRRDRARACAGGRLRPLDVRGNRGRCPRGAPAGRADGGGADTRPFRRSPAPNRRAVVRPAPHDAPAPAARTLDRLYGYPVLHDHPGRGLAGVAAGQAFAVLDRRRSKYRKFIGRRPCGHPGLSSASCSPSVRRVEQTCCIAASPVQCLCVSGRGTHLKPIVTQRTEPMYNVITTGSGPHQGEHWRRNAFAELLPPRGSHGPR